MRVVVVQGINQEYQTQYAHDVGKIWIYRLPSKQRKSDRSENINQLGSFGGMFLKLHSDSVRNVVLYLTLQRSNARAPSIRRVGGSDTEVVSEGSTMPA